MFDSERQRRVQYEDVFRALGHYFDMNHMLHIALFEMPNGFLVKAYGVLESQRGGGLSKAHHTFLISDAEIDTLLQEAYHRRRMIPVQPVKKSRWRRG